MRALIVALVVMLLLVSVPPLRADTVCTMIAEVETGAVLREEGDCDARVTPASTFKIPLAVMAFDAGILTDAGAPVMSYRRSDPDWGGASWTRDTAPADWMRFSVLWFSQRIAERMGAEALSSQARDLRYGNADFSGDPGFDNGLERAWIASSLQVSPREQLAFLRALLLGELPVRRDAIDHTIAIVEGRRVGDWEIYGKTGSAYPRQADRSFDYARGWGWYVGWARSAERSLVFVRLTQARERTPGSPGLLTRDAFLGEWAVLSAP